MRNRCFDMRVLANSGFTAVTTRKKTARAPEAMDRVASPLDLVPREGYKRLETLSASIVEATRQCERMAQEDYFGRAVSRLTDTKSLPIYHVQPKEGEIFAVPDLHVADGANVSVTRANVNGCNQIRDYEDWVRQGLLKEQRIQSGEIGLF